MIPNTMKVPVPVEYVFPAGALFLGVEPATDFDKRGQGDDQLRDKDTGERVWLVKVLDLDPEAGKFGATKEVKVKVIAPHQPVPPTSAIPGYPPAVKFTDHANALRGFPAVQGHRAEVQGASGVVDPRDGR